MVQRGVLQAKLKEGVVIDEGLLAALGTVAKFVATDFAKRADVPSGVISLAGKAMSQVTKKHPAKPLRAIAKPSKEIMKKTKKKKVVATAPAVDLTTSKTDWVEKRTKGGGKLKYDSPQMAAWRKKWE
jgi:hypothetical protein